MLLPALCAVEIWKASGIRTEDRLNALCEHFAKTYCLLDELATIRQQAKNSVPSWMFEYEE